MNLELNLLASMFTVPAKQKKNTETNMNEKKKGERNKKGILQPLD